MPAVYQGRDCSQNPATEQLDPARLWDSSIGAWVRHGAGVASGDWATLEMVLDVDTDQFVVSVDGVSETLPALGSTSLGEAIINMFNYGPGTPDYDVHASSFALGDVVPAPATKGDCRKGGYADFGFDHQGLCIASLVSNR